MELEHLVTYLQAVTGLLAALGAFLVAAWPWCRDGYWGGCGPRRRRKRRTT